MKNLKIGIVIFVLIAFLASFAAVAQEKQEKLTLGALLIMSGPLASFGETEYNAVNLAKEHLNEAGGPQGKELVVDLVDSTTNPSNLRDATKKLVNVKKVPAIVGPNIRSDVVVSITAPNHVVTISPTNTPEWVTRLDDDDYNFRTTVSDKIQGQILGKLAWERGFKTASSIYVNDPYGGPLSNIACDTFEELGGECMAEVAYNPGKASYKMELLMASRGNPDVLIMPAYVEDGITIIREAIAGEYFDQFLFTDGMFAQKIADETGDVLNDMYGTSPGTSESPSYNLYHEAFRGKYGHEPKAGFSEQAYDAAIVIGLAMAASDPDAYEEDPGKAIRDNLRSVANPPGEKVTAGAESIKKALELIEAGEDINYEGAAGSVDFDENGDVISGILIWKIEDGKIKTVRTEIPERE
ncbi:ABC transporter substrate-binding protein [Candidatus Bipolaricaulota bacterium]|nr:ABC transporter substrate-binding protein [Candidatus Bipolaricaulota bacterium]